VSDYRLDGRGSIPGRGKAFTLCVQTSSEAHPASYPVDNKGPSPEVKCGRRVTLITHPHLVPRSIMSRSYTASPSWSLRGVAGHLYFTLLSFNFSSFLSSTCPLFLSYINPSCCVTADSPDYSRGNRLELLSERPWDVYSFSHFSCMYSSRPAASSEFAPLTV
jgi:hypothetical protein